VKQGITLLLAYARNGIGDDVESHLERMDGFEASIIAKYGKSDSIHS
jgi:hypothetical protein